MSGDFPVRVVRGFPPPSRSPLAGAAAAFGMFDGVHRGHRRVLDAVVRLARDLGTAPAVITFEPHPQAVLGPGEPAPLTSFEYRLLLWARLGIRAAWVIPFDRAFASIPADRFVREVLSGMARLRGVVLGAEARFGRRCEGDAPLLSRLGPAAGLAVRIVATRSRRGAPVSSTALRAAVVRGDLAEARRLIGRPLAYFGPIVPGRRRGRRLGFPTANVDTGPCLLPPNGVYAGRARSGGAGRWAPAAVNIGVRPTFPGDGGAITFEAHLPGRRGTLRGALEVELLRRLRPERRFADASALARQIRRDLSAVRRIAALGASSP